MTPLWRRPFDAIERPLTAASESWVQSDTFMDLAAVAYRLQRRVRGGVLRYGEDWLHAWGLLSRGDAARVANQVASLERQVRQLRHELRRPEPEHQGGRRNGAHAQPAGSQRTA
jgi:hypothetical protein